MAVDVAVVRPGMRIGAIAVSATHGVVALVGASFVLRLLLALLHETPYIFPDEYIYSALARELAESGRPIVREGSSFFPAFLEPLLVAPFQLVGDPGLAYRLTQGAHALAMSLAAVPAYLIARHVGLRSGAALGAALVAVAVPDLVYVSFTLAEPVAYPLALAAVYAGVRALDRPTVRAQVAFLTAAGLVTLARLQYAVLIGAFLVAAALVQRRALRITLPLVALGMALATVIGPDQLLGPYRGLALWEPRAGELAGWLGAHALLLTWASGVALVPAAVAGTVLAMTRPRTQAERGFAALTTALAAMLVAESAVIADFESARFEERYLFALVPLLAIAAGLWCERGRLRAVMVVAGAAVLLVASLRVPASGYVFGMGKVDSPLLWAVAHLEQSIGVANASLALAIAIGAACAAAAVASFSRHALAILTGATLVTLTAVSVGAYAHAHGNARIVRAQDLPADARWIDQAGLSEVALLQTPGGSRRSAMEQLFWNRSVGDILLLGGAEPFDSFGARRVQIRDDGSLAVSGRPLLSPLLVQTYGVDVAFRGAVRVARGGSFELWKPSGRPRLALLFAGRFHDGWLARAGSIFVWPDARGRTVGTLRLALSMPPDTQVTPVRFAGGGVAESVVVPPGATRIVELRVDSCGPVSIGFETSKPGLLGDLRQVSVRAGMADFRPAQAVARRCR